jgi:hypothetical protein
VVICNHCKKHITTLQIFTFLAINAKKTYQHNRATQTVDICNRCKYHISVLEEKHSVDICNCCKYHILAHQSNSNCRYLQTLQISHQNIISIDICNSCKNLNQHCVAISTDHTNAELYVEKHTNLIGYNKSQNKQVRSKAPLSN